MRFIPLTSASTTNARSLRNLDGSGPSDSRTDGDVLSDGDGDRTRLPRTFEAFAILSSAGASCRWLHARKEMNQYRSSKFSDLALETISSQSGWGADEVRHKQARRLVRIFRAVTLPTCLNKQPRIRGRSWIL